MTIRRTLAALLVLSLLVDAQAQPPSKPQRKPRNPDAKNRPTNEPAPPEDPDYQRYGIYAKTAPRPQVVEAVSTTLPLTLEKGARIALIGNTLLDRAQHFGHLEAVLQQQFPDRELVVRTFAWSADEVDLQPRPDNFADIDQHLAHFGADVVIAAYGFNESFAGGEGLEAFRTKLTAYVAGLRSKGFNGKTAPRVVLLSPIANENVEGVAAADLNNERIALYADVVRDVAMDEQVGYVDVFAPTKAAMESPGGDLTTNGAHLNADGYALFAKQVARALTGDEPPAVNEAVRAAVLDKNRQHFRRYRPLNTFYYTGGRNKSYGYLDFLPAMKNFDLMASNRDERTWSLAKGEKVTDEVDDSNVPPLPETKESRGANRWMSAADEFEAFRIDPRFDVTLFAGEEEFPDIAAPIQMRWDNRGRLWVACSTTYPHVYPGNEPNDKLVILEDTDGDGKADKSTLFADDLHIPLSFEFGDGGVYVSEQPDLTFVKDTDGDDKADVHVQLLTGFGTEDSHHSLHDFSWTPDGDLVFRESIFHHSQVETPYGPVRQQNSGWFRFEPAKHRLTSFGTYHSTNPWGVTYDDWGQHVASHPVYAEAHHALDPPYPTQHPAPAGLQAYSGVCGHEFVDFPQWPEEMQGGFVKVRYKPTNRVEFHRWKEGPYGYEEEYVGDILFSTNLSFIPVDLRYGPDGAMFVCDWYNPVKGHAQYSLRDERRDRHSGRIWRIMPKGAKPQEPPKFAGAPIADLLDVLKRPEYRYRYWAKRELRERDAAEVKAALDTWVADLDVDAPRYRHHQIEAVWLYRGIDATNLDLLRDLLKSPDHHARAAAVHQLRFWFPEMNDAEVLLRRAAHDPVGIVRMQAVNTASYFGTKTALDAVLDVARHPHSGHLSYAIACSLGSAPLRAHWENAPNAVAVTRIIKAAGRTDAFDEPKPTPEQAKFDKRKGLKTVRIGCVPERMQFTVKQFAATVGQPIKIVFTNPDATDHNLLVVRPGTLAEVGMAANEMARDPANAAGDFIPESKRELILEASPMIGPTRKTRVHVLRFEAPDEPGLYPYVCTFPGHWVIMKGVMVVARNLKDVDAMLAAAQPKIIKKWTLADFGDLPKPPVAPATVQDEVVMRGMQAFVKARCNQCHIVAGHGVNLGPDLTDVAKRYKGRKLLRQMLLPSSELNEKYRTWQFVMESGKVVIGVIVKEEPEAVHVRTNLLDPNAVVKLDVKEIDERIASSVSAMPEGMLDVLTKQEIHDILVFLESGGPALPEHLKHDHGTAEPPGE